MTLFDLKEIVDGAIARAADFGESAEQILVSIQIVLMVNLSGRLRLRPYTTITSRLPASFCLG